MLEIKLRAFPGDAIIYKLTKYNQYTTLYKKYQYNISLHSLFYIQRYADPLEYAHEICEGYIFLKFTFKTQQNLQETIEYLKSNLSALYVKTETQGDEILLKFDKNMDITQQIVYHNQKYTGNFTYYRRESKLIDPTRCAEIHIYDDNVMILLTQHSITDGRYIQDLIQSITTKQPLKLELADSQYEIFKEEYKKYLKKYNEGYYKYKNVNDFEIIDVNQPQKLYIEKIYVDINQKPWLLHRFTQKIMIINSLYKLYVLQKQGRLSDIEQLLKKGIAINQPYVADARKYDSRKDSKYGCCALSFVENYILKGDKTVEEYTKYFTEQLEIRRQNNEMCNFLKVYDDAKQQKTSTPNYHIIESLMFSNTGRNKTDFYEDVKFGFYMTNHDQLTQAVLFIYSINELVHLMFYCPEEFQNYNITKIVSIIIDNVQNDKKIIDIWNAIKDK